MSRRTALLFTFAVVVCGLGLRVAPRLLEKQVTATPGQRMRDRPRGMLAASLAVEGLLVGAALIVAVRRTRGAAAAALLGAFAVGHLGGGIYPLIPWRMYAGEVKDVRVLELEGVTEKGARVRLEPFPELGRHRLMTLVRERRLDLRAMALDHNRHGERVIAAYLTETVIGGERRVLASVELR